ncbi:MAG: cytochrome c [Thiohalomonadales bacterium]
MIRLNRAGKQLVNPLFLGVIFFIGSVMTSENGYAQQADLVAADASAGQQKSSTCQGCHGVDGNSYADNWPNLASQHASYIEKQIRNFQSGKRQDPTMTSMVVGLSEQDIADIAAYFSQQAIVASPAVLVENNLLSNGRKIYKGGNLYSGVPACSGCHGPNGVGIGPSKFPVLAGQKIDYLTKTLRDFRNSTRNNDPRSIMQNISARMTDKEITSVATYINSLAADNTNRQANVAPTEDVNSEERDRLVSVQKR